MQNVAVNSCEEFFDQDGYRFYPEKALGSKGRYGLVIEAEDRRMVQGMTNPQPLAAKIMHRDHTEANKEATKLRKLLWQKDAAHIISFVRVIEHLGSQAGEFEGQVALLMERAEMDLAHWRLNKAPTEEDFRQIVLETASGLLALHGRDLAHGDLHSGNILLASGGWKVADLSATIEVDPSTGMAGRASPGAPIVQSPERRANRRASKADDMWALGTMLIFAVTGSYPFPRQAQDLSLADVTNSLSLVPEDMKLVAGRLLTWDPAERITAAGLVSQLESRRRAARSEDDGGSTLPKDDDGYRPDRHFDVSIERECISVGSGAGCDLRLEGLPGERLELTRITEKDSGRQYWWVTDLANRTFTRSDGRSGTLEACTYGGIIHVDGYRLTLGRTGITVHRLIGAD